MLPLLLHLKSPRMTTFYRRSCLTTCQCCLYCKTVKGSHSALVAHTPPLLWCDLFLLTNVAGLLSQKRGYDVWGYHYKRRTTTTTTCHRARGLSLSSDRTSTLLSPGIPSADLDWLFLGTKIALRRVKCLQSVILGQFLRSVDLLVCDRQFGSFLSGWGKQDWYHHGN